MRRRFISILAGVAVLAGLLIAPAPQTAQALDVYITPGIHELNGRLWSTRCEKYSSTVERCRTEIQATTISYSNGRYVEHFGWAFNNLTYKPSPRAQWAGNILATPGEHTSAGRLWKTECDTAWTGRNACRSSILTTTYSRSGSGYSQSSTWVFNNIVRFSDSIDTAFCVPAASAGAGIGDDSTGASGESPSPAVAESGEPTLPPDEADPTPQDLVAPESVEAEPEPAQSQTPESQAPDSESSSPEASPEITLAPQQAGGAQVEAVPAASSITLGSIMHPSYPTGVLYDRLGAIRVTGSATEATGVRVELVDATGKVRSSATVAVSANGTFTASVAGGFAGSATVRATVGSATATRSVELRTSGIESTVASSIDPLATTQLTGTLTPGIGDALVTAYVYTGSGWVPAGAARTLDDGRFSIPFAYGTGSLGTWQVRTCATLNWGATVPAAHSSTVTRARIANAVVTDTTAAEVASTYRSGCPVGPSGLSTIRINQQSMDGHVYRGEIIVRRDRAADVAHVFTKAFEGGFPVYQMTNPNAFGGDDVASMAANNTSAFNCRKVVGNPYALSPHSYGYAVDLNPWQNPYRDPQGRWYPSTEHVSRTPVVPGMLTTSSIPVVQFKARGWEWFSGWDWHHFEKR